MQKTNNLCEVRATNQKKLLFETYQNIFQDTWRQEDFIDYINRSWVDSFLLFSKSNFPIGVCILSNISKEIEIIKFGIKSKYRNQGYGFFFLSDIIELYKISKKKNIYLEVSTKNIFAIRLYLKLGFEKLNIRYKYYKKSANNFEDALIMKKKLILFNSN
tara:strand:- start:2 stop:481 length:480 start_codon:yes stop_codon:yes gene_type:complete